MKLKKRIVAAMAAMVMAVSMMGMSASADQTRSWGLLYVPNSSGTNKGTDDPTFVTTRLSNSITETCTTFDVGQTSNGLIPHARYYVTYKKHGATSAPIVCSSTYYHYQTQGTHTITLSTPVDIGFDIIVNYTLVQPTGGPCSATIRGSVTSYGVA